MRERSSNNLRYNLTRRISMKNVVWKYVVENSLGTVQSLLVPAGAEVVYGKDCSRGTKLWFRVNPNGSQSTIKLVILGTNDEIPEGFSHVNSFSNTPTRHIFVQDSSKAKSKKSKGKKPPPKKISKKTSKKGSKKTKSIRVGR
jgi:hypothetical protein